MKKQQVTQTILMVFFGICTMMVGVKIALSGFCVDEEYAFVQAFRFLKGDLPILEMWELHQTSMFGMAFLQWVYYQITGSMTGVVVFVHFVTLLIHTGVMLYFYSVMRNEIDKLTAFLLSCVLFLTLPKIAFIPDYTMFMYWGTIVTSVTLYSMFTKEKWKFCRALIVGISLTIMTFGYPTFLPIDLLLGVYILVKSKNKKADALFLILPAVLCGGVYLIGIFRYLSFAEFLSCIRLIVSDSSHTATLADKAMMHWNKLIEVGRYSVGHLLLAGVVAAVDFLVQWFSGKKRKENFLPKRALGNAGLVFLFTFFITIMGRQIYVWKCEKYYPNYPSLEYFYFTVFALFMALYRSLKKESEKGRTSFIRDAMILFPFLCYICVLCASNQDFLVSILFLAPMCASGWMLFNCNNKSLSDKKIVRTVFCVLIGFWVIVLMFGRTYLVRIDGGEHYSIMRGVSCAEKGPIKGLWIATETADKYSNCYDEWLQNVPENETVLLIANSTIPYMFYDELANREYQIATPTTISTPQFDFRLLEYWKMNPDKYPSVIVMNKDYYYDLHVLETLLESDFTEGHSGDTFTVYIRNN